MKKKIRIFQTLSTIEIQVWLYDGPEKPTNDVGENEQTTRLTFTAAGWMQAAQQIPY